MKEFRLQGIAASGGIAMGPAYCYVQPDLTIPCRERRSVEQEMTCFEIAVGQARQELQGVMELMEKQAGADVAAIFEAHQMILDDPLLAGRTAPRGAQEVLRRAQAGQPAHVLPLPLPGGGAREEPCPRAPVVTNEP